MSHILKYIIILLLGNYNETDKYWVMYEKRNTKPSYYIHVEALDETNNSLFKCNIDEVKLYDRQVCSSLDY